jgi:hypothetical protein
MGGLNWLTKEIWQILLVSSQLHGSWNGGKQVNFSTKKKENRTKEKISPNLVHSPRRIVLEGVMWRARCHQQALGKLSYAQWKPQNVPETRRDGGAKLEQLNQSLKERGETVLITEEEIKRDKLQNLK